MNIKLRSLLFWTAIVLIPGQAANGQLKEAIEREFKGVSGTFAVAFQDLTTDEQLLIRERETFHAASTMKTPVMIEVYKQVAAGTISLKDSVTIKNEFKSIVDGSNYSLKVEDDSDSQLYSQVGEKRTVYELMYDMIIVTSNLATNILIEVVDARKVMETMRQLGAKDIQVLRGVEDSKAFQKGLNNTTTAYDLMLIFSKLARGEVVNAEASKAMINILLDQKFNNMIPARLPKDVRVAHKSGFFKGVKHDSGIIILPDGRRYVLVLLSKNLGNDDEGINAIARVSEIIYHHVTGK